MKFKVGDRVEVLDTDTLLVSQKNSIGKIYYISKVRTDNTTAPYLLATLDHYSFFEKELKIATIHNSKLARNLYKNQIDYIDEVSQLIYLK